MASINFRVFYLFLFSFHFYSMLIVILQPWNLPHGRSIGSIGHTDPLNFNHRCEWVLFKRNSGQSDFHSKLKHYRKFHHWRTQWHLARTLPAERQPFDCWANTWRIFPWVHPRSIVYGGQIAGRLHGIHFADNSFQSQMTSVGSQHQLNRVQRLQQL